MKKRIVSFLLALVMAVSLLPVSAFAVEDTASSDVPAIQAAETDIFKIDGEYEVAEYIESGFYGAPTLVVRIPTNTTEIKINIDAEYGVLTDYGYEAIYGEFKPVGEYHTWSFDDEKVKIGDIEKEKWVDAQFAKYDLYIAAFVDTLDIATEFADIIFFKSDVPLSGGGLSDEEKKPLKDLLDTVTGENELNWYQKNDRYNGKDTDTIVDKTIGFWSQFVSDIGPRSIAEGFLKTASSTAQIEKARQDLAAAITKLIPADRANTTLLYEELQNAPSAENYTAKSWAIYQTAHDKAETLMATMFDADGNPTDNNKAAANESIETLTAELETARKALDENASSGAKTDDYVRLLH